MRRPACDLPACTFLSWQPERCHTIEIFREIFHHFYRTNQSRKWGWMAKSRLDENIPRSITLILLLRLEHHWFFFSRDFIVCNIINYLSVVINIVYAFWNSSCMSCLINFSQSTEFYCCVLSATLILSIFTYHRKHNFREFLSGWNFQFLGEWSGFLFAFIFKHISTYLFSFEKYLFYLTNQNANYVDIENIILQTKISAPVLKFSSKRNNANEYREFS